MELRRQFPFTKLQLPPGEVALWCATNPTFHRSSEYGIVVTREALYLYYVPFYLWLWFARWRRLPISDITSICFCDSRWRPKLQIKLRNSARTFSTPHDTYADEMDFDRKNLSEAARLVNEQLHLQRATVVGA
jgi:hypothetical protein